MSCNRYIPDRVAICQSLAHNSVAFETNSMDRRGREVLRGVSADRSTTLAAARRQPWPIPALMPAIV
jgi:hypothetical protein